MTKIHEWKLNKDFKDSVGDNDGTPTAIDWKPTRRGMVPKFNMEVEDAEAYERTERVELAAQDLSSVVSIPFEKAHIDTVKVSVPGADGVQMDENDVNDYPDGLVDAWNFNGNSNGLLGNNGTDTNMSYTSYSALFNGNDSKIEFGISTIIRSTNNFTITVSFNTDCINGTVIAQEPEAQDSARIIIIDGKLVATPFEYASAGYTSTNNINDSRNHTVTISRYGLQKRVFVDGLKVVDTVAGGNNNDAQGNLFAGMTSAYGAMCSGSVINELNVYGNVFLSDSDIIYLHTGVNGTAARTLPNGTWTAVEDGSASLPLDPLVEIVETDPTTYPQNDSLVALYPFESNSNDYSGNGNDGIDTNITYGVDGAEFNGIDSKIMLDSIDDMKWFHTTFNINTTGNDLIGKWGGTASKSFAIVVNSDGRVGVFLSADGTSFIERYSTSLINLDENTTLDVVLDTDSVYIYIDGVLDSTHIVNTTVFSQSRITYIGNPYISGWLDGILYDMVIFDYVPDSSEISQLYYGNTSYPHTTAVEIVDSTGTLTSSDVIVEGIDYYNAYNISCDKIDITDKLTVSAYINKSPDTSEMAICGNQSFTDRASGFYLGIKAGKLQASIHDELVESAALDWQDDKFYEVGMTFDAGAVTLYRDGVSVVTGTTTTTSIDSTVETFGIGSRSGDAAIYTIDGCITDVRMWDGALTATEYLTEWNATKTAYGIIPAERSFTHKLSPEVDENTVFATDMSTKNAADGTLVDLSGNSNHGEINGAVRSSGYFRDAMRFDGTSNYIDVGDCS